MYLYGKHSIRERLKNHPKTIRRINIEQGFADEDILRLIAHKQCRRVVLSSKEMLRLYSGPKAQGIIAEVNPFDYCDYDRLLDQCIEAGDTPVFLDSVDDPQNVGAIIRTLACMGGFSLVLSEHRACSITETVLHVASGGENYVRIARVTNIASALREAKKKGFWIAGTVVRQGDDLTTASLPFPLALVIGSEGKGIRPVIEKQLEVRLHLPMRGAPLSFNVGIACGLFCYEIIRQRKRM